MTEEIPLFGPPPMTEFDKIMNEVRALSAEVLASDDVVALVALMKAGDEMAKVTMGRLIRAARRAGLHGARLVGTRREQRQQRLLALVPEGIFEDRLAYWLERDRGRAMGVLVNLGKSVEKRLAQGRGVA